MTSNEFRIEENHSIAIRLWHWCFAILMMSTIVVVLLASTLFRTRNNIGLVQDQLKQKNIVIDNDQARSVSHAFNDRLWDLHTWIGYGIVLFFIGRLLIELILPSDQRFLAKIKNAVGLPRNPDRNHYILVKRIYALFYVLILIMGFTGIAMAFDNIAFFRGIYQPAKQVHSFIQYLIYGFVVIHIAGLILAETGKYPGVVSGMIHGNKKIKS